MDSPNKNSNETFAASPCKHPWSREQGQTKTQAPVHVLANQELQAACLTPSPNENAIASPLPCQASMPGAETTPNQSASSTSNSQQYRNSAQHRSPPHQVRVRCDLVSLAPQDTHPIEDENVFQFSVYSRTRRSSLHSSPLHPLPPLPHDGQVRIFSRFLLSFHGAPTSFLSFSTPSILSIRTVTSSMSYRSSIAYPPHYLVVVRSCCTTWGKPLK
jgi:hypothetical protein